MPAGKIVESESLYRADPMARPYVLKPVNEGSSVGVAIVTDGRQLRQSRSAATSPGPWQHFDQLLAEPFIKGRELTVAVLGDEALAVTELKPKAGFYDYDAKYTDGLTEHVCPAEVPDDIAAAMMDMAARAHRLLGCKGASRSDFRWDDEQGEAGLYLLEVNTQPGMTPLSLVPEQAQAQGHRLWRAGRAADRGGACDERRARPPRRRRAAPSRARPRQGRGPQEDRQAAAGRPGARQQARRPGFGGFLLAIGAGRRWSRSTFRPRPSARPARRSAAPASPSAAIRSSASTT